jgi:hypothetical protein
MTSVLKFGHRDQIYIEACHVTREPGTEGCIYKPKYVKDFQQPPEARRVKEGYPCRAFGE